MDRLALFHAAPYPLKVLAASWHGRKLQRWRYDPDTDARVEAALERESWGADRWASWQQDAVNQLLDRAFHQVPHYRRLWQELDRAELPELTDWPRLAKEELRSNPQRLVADDVDIDDLYAESSSGSTGTPVRLWWSHDTVKAWYALVEARCRRWYGVSRHDRWAILGGQIVTAQARSRPPFWVWSAPLRQLYLSSLHLAPAYVPHYIEAMRRHGVRHLYGYPSAVHALAVHAADGKLDPSQLNLEVIVTNAEPLFAHQRDAIERVFGCPVRETYGMAELVAAASECQHGRLHLWPEVGMIEVDPESGEILATGLLNHDQPLIRYAVGDRARLASAGTACPCGRTLPIIEAIDGRVDDVIVTPDGRHIGRLDTVFKGDLPIREAQIVQEELDTVFLRVVPASGWDQAAEDDVERRLRQRLGDSIDIVVETVDTIERSANGKLRAVISRFG